VQLGRLPSNRIICWRVVFLRKTSRPALSCPCRWKLCLPRSMPTSVAVLMMMASENKTPCQSLALTGCGGDHLINPGRTGAFWRKLEGDKDSRPQRGENTGLEATSDRLNEPCRPK